MTDSTVTPARPVSLFTIVFLLAVFAAFLLVLRYFYHPNLSPAFVGPVDNASKDFEWRKDRESRRKALRELHDASSKQAGSYAWIDQKAGTVHLPIERAMELTARDLAAKQPTRGIRDLPSFPQRKF